uniref:Uncharacterized protein n=1 Tax=Salmonella enterica subsp. indica TaxID=59207 RepID=I3W3U4_SALER|nr:hypothetical protein [Salmonella enterica subsp. indica]
MEPNLTAVPTCNILLIQKDNALSQNFLPLSTGGCIQDAFIHRQKPAKLISG